PVFVHTKEGKALLRMMGTLDDALQAESLEDYLTVLNRATLQAIPLLNRVRNPVIRDWFIIGIQGYVDYYRLQTSKTLEWHGKNYTPSEYLVAFWGFDAKSATLFGTISPDSDKAMLESMMMKARKVWGRAVE